MATRSFIGIEEEPEVYKFIYCHWDGYLEYNGMILNEAYKTRDKVIDLVNGGDISSLGVDPNLEITFNEPVPTIYMEDDIEDTNQVFTVRYGEDDSNISFSLEGKEELDEVLKLGRVPYIYVYTLDDEWKYSGSENHKKLTSLNNYLKRQDWYNEKKEDLNKSISKVSKLKTKIEEVNKNKQEEKHLLKNSMIKKILVK